MQGDGLSGRTRISARITLRPRPSEIRPLTSHNTSPTTRDKDWCTDHQTSPTLADKRYRLHSHYGRAGLICTTNGMYRNARQKTHLIEEYEAKHATAASLANKAAKQGRGRPPKVIVKRRTRVVKVEGLSKVWKMRRSISRRPAWQTRRQIEAVGALQKSSSKGVRGS